MAMQVEISNRQEAIDCAEEDVLRVLQLALETENRDAELSVVLTGNDEVARLNKRFLDRTGVTDVLAFPYDTEGRGVNGEIVVNAQLARNEAARRSHSAEDELMLYIVHGLLHLLGYDDHSPEDSRQMRRREREVLEAAGRSVEF